MPSKIVVIGCGYVGGRAAFRLREAGFTVSVVARSPARLREFSEAGFSTIHADVTRPESLAAIPACDAAVFAVGFNPKNEPLAARRQVIVDGLAATLNSLMKSSPRFIFISTTSVYGEHAGRWIDESVLCTPSTESGRVFFEAEELLRRRVSGHATALRLAGIYGPGRIERRLDQLRCRTPISNSPNDVLNLIHVDDAVSAIAAAVECKEPPPIVNVADGAPTTLGEYLEELARLTGLPKPVFDDNATSTGASRSGSKRVSNEILRKTLNVTLQFPSFREGLRASLAR